MNLGRLGNAAPSRAICSSSPAAVTAAAAAASSPVALACTARSARAHIATAAGLMAEGWKPQGGS